MTSSTDAFGLDAVRELLQLIQQTDITEILIERGDTRLHIKRDITVAVPSALPATVLPYQTSLPTASSVPPQPLFTPPPTATAEQQVEMPAGYTVAAPMAGAFYAAPSPKDPPFVQEGDEVRAGDTVGIIAAAKVMNEIKSEVGGRVARMLVKNGQPVEYRQAIMVIEPM